MIKRNIVSNLLDALSDTPVVLINGARQTGKSTLVQSLAQEEHPALYITLDDASVLAAAQQDPAGFISQFDGPVILDEVQRVPDLFLAIKATVDRCRLPGRFLLTGSANVLLLPKLSESLTGRMEILTLWPFSQGELEAKQERFINAIFESKLRVPQDLALERNELIRRVLVGGYPEVQGRLSAKRRDSWYQSYMTTMMQREVRELAHIERLAAIPRLLSLLAARTGSLLNLSELASAAGLPKSTLRRYLALLEATFLLVLLPAWSTNLSKRLIKSPKIILNDSGLAGHLIGLNKARIARDSTGFGHLLENFAGMELCKQITWCQTRLRLYHFRSYQGHEVDFVLENPAGEIVGIEVKASSTVKANDFKGLKHLRELLDERFLRGIVLYTGDQPVPFASNLYALPVSALWRSSE
jgi:predicted AAA+ superfamily ATPase